MATLMLRSLGARDLPALRHVHQRLERLDPATARIDLPGALGRSASAVLPEDSRRLRVYVALVDGELCAYAVLRPRPARFSWDVQLLVVGSPHLDAGEDESIELWTALLEYAIKRAGEAGAKRLFAAASECSAGHRSLMASGFDAYTRVYEVRGRCVASSKTPPGIRPQEPSDVWSIHHLYHRITPRPVQFAEALTSTTWELPRHSIWRRLPLTTDHACAFVIDSDRGIMGYCRVEQERAEVRLSLLLDPSIEADVAQFAFASVARAGVSVGTPASLVVPGYAMEWIAKFESAGFENSAERLAMVRHTTAPVAIQNRLAPLPVIELGERSARGVPSYYSPRYVCARSERSRHGARGMRVRRPALLAASGIGGFPANGSEHTTN